MTRRLEPPRARSGTHPPSAWVYWRFVALHPISAALSFSVAVVIGCAAGPFAAGATFLAAGSVVAISGYTPFTRRWVERALDEQRRRDRAAQRESRLERGGSSRRRELDELTELVEEIERTDPDENERLELEDLLEHYVDVAVALEGYLRAARRSSALVEATEEGSRAERGGSRSRLQGELVRRRIQHREECSRRAVELEAELDAISEFLRLVAERAVCPGAGLDIVQQLDRRIWELDVHDHAMRQLSAADVSDRD